MKVDNVSKGISLYVLVLSCSDGILMVIAGFPQIIIYTSLLWGICGHLSIPLCERAV